MKVMVVTPVFGGSIPIAHHCAQALAELGCETYLLDLTRFQSSFRKARESGQDQAAQAIAFYESVAAEVQSEAERFAPDLVLALILAPLHQGVLEWLRERRIQTAYWFVDNDKRFPFWRVQCPWYDHYFTIQTEPFLSELRKAGARSCSYLPNACPRAAHEAVELTSDELAHFGSDVAFMGTPYPNRVAAFEKLADFDLGLWGKGWSTCESSVVSRVREGSRMITPDEEVKIYASSKIVLNLHTDLGAGIDDARDFINPRTFIAAGVGTMQVVDERSLLARHFVPGEEVVVFSDEDDLRAKLQYYLDNSDERQAIAARAKKRVLAEHTYSHRMQAVMDAVSAQRESD